MLLTQLEQRYCIGLVVLVVSPLAPSVLLGGEGAHTGGEEGRVRVVVVVVVVGVGAVSSVPIDLP